jgi:hypothetical protein
MVLRESRGTAIRFLVTFLFLYVIDHVFYTPQPP